MEISEAVPIAWTKGTTASKSVRIESYYWIQVDNVQNKRTDWSASQLLAVLTKISKLSIKSPGRRCCCTSIKSFNALCFYQPTFMCHPRNYILTNWWSLDSPELEERSNETFQPPVIWPYRKAQLARRHRGAPVRRIYCRRSPCADRAEPPCSR